MSPLVAKDYVIAHLDSRMQRSAEVTKRVRGDRGGGIPWLVILDREGQELVTSDGPKGNIGCPVEDHEIAWFMKMVGQTRQHMTDAEVESLHKALIDFAAAIKQKRTRQAPANGGLRLDERGAGALSPQL